MNDEEIIRQHGNKHKGFGSWDVIELMQKARADQDKRWRKAIDSELGYFGGKDGVLMTKKVAIALIEEALAQGDKS